MLRDPVDRLFRGASSAFPMFDDVPFCPFMSTVFAFVHVLEFFNIDEYRAALVYEKYRAASKLIISDVAKFFDRLSVFAEHLLAF